MVDLGPDGLVPRWGSVGWNLEMLEKMLDGIRCAREPDRSCRTSLDFNYSIFCIYKRDAQSLNRGTLTDADYRSDASLPKFSWIDRYLLTWQDLVSDFEKTCQRLNRIKLPALNYPGGLT